MDERDHIYRNRKTFEDLIRDQPPQIVEDIIAQTAFCDEEILMQILNEQTLLKVKSNSMQHCWFSLLSKFNKFTKKNLNCDRRCGIRSIKLATILKTPSMYSNFFLHIVKQTNQAVMRYNKHQIKEMKYNQQQLYFTRFRGKHSFNDEDIQCNIKRTQKQVQLDETEIQIIQNIVNKDQSLNFLSYHYNEAAKRNQTKYSYKQWYEIANNHLVATCQPDFQIKEYAEKHDLIYQVTQHNGIYQVGVINRKHVELFNKFPNVIISDFSFVKTANRNRVFYHAITSVSPAHYYFLLDVMFFITNEKGGESIRNLEFSLFWFKQHIKNLNHIKMFVVDRGVVYNDFVKYFRIVNEDGTTESDESLLSRVDIATCSWHRFNNYKDQIQLTKELKGKLAYYYFNMVKASTIEECHIWKQKLVNITNVDFDVDDLKYFCLCYRDVNDITTTITATSGGEQINGWIKKQLKLFGSSLFDTFVALSCTSPYYNSRINNHYIKNTKIRNNPMGQFVNYVQQYYEDQCLIAEQYSYYIDNGFFSICLFDQVVMQFDETLDPIDQECACRIPVVAHLPCAHLIKYFQIKYPNKEERQRNLALYVDKDLYSFNRYMDDMDLLKPKNQPVLRQFADDTNKDDTKNEIISFDDDDDQVADKIVKAVQESLNEVSEGEQRLIEVYRSANKQEKQRLVNFADMIGKKENIELEKIAKNTKYGGIRYKRHDERKFK
ncbi:SWIM-type [Hexamita inflata]|uniref:SWIM-type n=1 Tax=Hexamita inflata TaxID=28002 RepID=A0AA86QE13_9EUKA|nr:SWIM-type [Hexamita inflata]